MTFVSFDTVPVQSVILPGGQTAVVRVLRGNSPMRSGYLFGTSFWLVKAALARLAFALDISSTSSWRVEVESSVDGVNANLHAATRGEAVETAARVYDELRRTGGISTA